MGYKAFGVNTRICAGAAEDTHGRTLKKRDGLLDHLLDAEGVLLILPARIGCAVVRYNHFVLTLHFVTV